MESPEKELEKFIPFNLFNNDIQVIMRDVQLIFDSSDKCRLQNVIKFKYKQYLDKTATF